MVHKTQYTTQPYNAEVSEATKRRAFTSGEIPVAVYGLGKMGLPLAVVLSDVTTNVTGVDIDATVVETISRGDCPVRGEPGLEEAVHSAVTNDRFKATTDAVRAAEHAHTHIAIVPTLIDEDNKPDLSSLKDAVRSIGAGLQSGDMVIIESTVPPGTCREIIEPLLVETSGVSAEEFGLAFCPERTASGRALRDITESYPKVVGGVDTESTRVARILYSEVTSNEVVPVSDATTAECVKLFEGLYRDVNIALANELARLGEEFAIDVNEAISVASMPSYCHIHSPGPGVGGHCIPYYPHFVIERSETPLPLLKEARHVNESMPSYTVSLLEEKLDTHGLDISTATIALLGITYRGGVDEIRAAPSFPIAKMLSDRGATVYAADPVCTDSSTLEATRVTTDVLPDLDLDAILIVTAHEEFREIPYDQMEDVLILDGRNMLDSDELPNTVYTLGDGTRETTGRTQEANTQ